jgi:hypothetical protein
MRNVLFLLAILFLPELASAAPATSWADATAPLTELKGRAVTCAALLKRFGKPAQIADHQLAYGTAKAGSDAVIEGLLTALAARDTPASLASLKDRLAKSVTDLAGFCNSVHEIILANTPPGERDVWSVLAQILGIDNLVNKVSAGIATIYDDYRGDDALTRKIIQNQLEFARWPDFAAVEPAPSH